MHFSGERARPALPPLPPVLAGHSAVDFESQPQHSWGLREVPLMQHSRQSRTWIAVATASLLLALVLMGCNQKPQHPDVKTVVDTAMTRNSLGVVNVAQDRD